MRGLPSVRMDPNPLTHSFTLQRQAALSHPNSGWPEFGTSSRPKSDKSDFGWGEGTSGDNALAACDAIEPVVDRGKPNGGPLQLGAMPLSVSSLIALLFFDRCASPMPRSTFGALVNWMLS